VRWQLRHHGVLEMTHPTRSTARVAVIPGDIGVAGFVGADLDKCVERGGGIDIGGVDGVHGVVDEYTERVTADQGVTQACLALRQAETRWLGWSSDYCRRSTEPER
jgi:hypothetical protein